MNSVELEVAFDQFLDNKVYDKAESAIFDLVWAAFNAGWNAAKRDNITLIEQ